MAIRDVDSAQKAQPVQRIDRIETRAAIVAERARRDDTLKAAVVVEVGRGEAPPAGDLYTAKGVLANRATTATRAPGAERVAAEAPAPDVRASAPAARAIDRATTSLPTQVTEAAKAAAGPEVAASKAITAPVLRDRVDEVKPQELAQPKAPLESPPLDPDGLRQARRRERIEDRESVRDTEGLFASADEQEDTAERIGERGGGSQGGLQR